jgi:adenylate cyclase
LDLAWSTRIGRAYAEGLRLAANVENEAYRARFMGPLLASGADQRTAMELAAQLATEFLPLVDRAFMGIYRRQQEVVWTEDLVEDIENELDRAGVLGRPERVPAMSFLDLVGYTRLTEERGDAAAAELAGALAVLVDRSCREHGGVPVKWLGDGVMVHFREPAGAVLSALRLVEQLPEAGLPPAHVGVAAGPVVTQGGDYFGRTVNLAARIAARAGAGQVLVSGSVAEAASPEGVAFVELGELRLKGFARPVQLLEASRAQTSDASAWPRRGLTESSSPSGPAAPATTHELTIRTTKYWPIEVRGWSGQVPGGERRSCQALGSLRYSPQAQSRASSGVPAPRPLGRTESSYPSRLAR